MKKIRETRKLGFALLFAVLLLALTGLTVPVRAAVPTKLTVTAGKTGQLKLARKLTVPQSRIVNKAKERIDYIRLNGFHYGDAQLNPAFDESEHLVSCDRYVTWVLYDLGFHDLPQLRGLWVYWPDHPEYDLETWCINHNFDRIDSKEYLQPGDIVFTGADRNRHVFLLGYSLGNGAWDRYDCGNEEFIYTEQPLKMPIDDVNLRPDLPFRYAYRITVPKITLKSSDNSIAKVNSQGLVKGVSQGVCKVTAESALGKKVYTITVKPSSDKPGQPTFTASNKISEKKKTFTVTTSTVNGADGFEIEYSRKETLESSVTKDVEQPRKAVRVVVDTRKSQERYYIRVRAYKMLNGEKLYGPWSEKESVKSK